MRNKANRRGARVRARLDKLPQELYDKIYDFTFSAEPGNRYLDCFVDPSYRPSKDGMRPLFQKPDSIHLLHVDRASRKQFARSYYGGSGAVFISPWISKSVISGPPHDTCHIWLSSLPKDHRAMIRDVRIVLPDRVEPPSYREFQVRRRCLEIRRRILRLDYTADFGEDVWNAVTVCYLYEAGV